MDPLNPMHAPASSPGRQHGRRFVRNAAVLALAWLCLNGPDAGSWMVGVPTILGAAALGAALPRHRVARLRIARLLPFAVYFLGESIRGGWDVARRVLQAGMPVHPGFVRFTTSLPPGSPRYWFMGLIGLVPGTVAAGLEGDEVLVHCIDVTSAPEAGLRNLERRVAELFRDEMGGGR